MLTLKEAMPAYGPFLKGRWSKLIKEEPRFASLEEGTFVYVAPGKEEEIDLTGSAGERLHLFIGSGAKLTARLPQSPVLDIALEDGAQLFGVAPGFQFVRATQKRDSLLHLVSLVETDVDQEFRVFLQGENSEARLYGLWQLSGTAKARTNIHMEHVAPHCRSLQLFKGVLSDASRSHFEGKIYVHPEAQKTDAFQLNNNLLLSDRATAHSEPNLEIFADDVKASHGATVGQFDTDQLFYLRSRGLSEAVAKELLVEAFLSEVRGAIL